MVSAFRNCNKSPWIVLRYQTSLISLFFLGPANQLLGLGCAGLTRRSQVWRLLPTSVACLPFCWQSQMWGFIFRLMCLPLSYYNLFMMLWQKSNNPRHLLLFLAWQGHSMSTCLVHVTIFCHPYSPVAGGSFIAETSLPLSNNQHFLGFLAKCYSGIYGLIWTGYRVLFFLRLWSSFSSSNICPQGSEIRSWCYCSKRTNVIFVFFTGTCSLSETLYKNYMNLHVAVHHTVTNLEKGVCITNVDNIHLSCTTLYPDLWHVREHQCITVFYTGS